MAKELVQQSTSPSGGMNQDDSMIAPSVGTEGISNYYQSGDYKYALNARIGSSRGDTFGDLESIISTLKVEDYNAYSSLVSNPEFTGSISPWSQAPNGVTWVYSLNSARISTTLGTTTNILYQNISPSKKRISVSFSYQIVSGFPNGIKAYIVFLNSGVEMSGFTTRINNVGITQTETKKYLQFDIPTGCNGIGIKFDFNTGSTSSTLALHYFRVSGWKSATQLESTEKVVGWLRDETELRVYYAVWSSTLNCQCIRFWDYQTNAVFELFRWSGLLFTQNAFVKFAKISNWLGFTDRLNRPRLIDVNSIGDLFLELGNNFREFHISFHKWAPTMPPIAKLYYDGSTDNRSKFGKKYFQFAYQYIYHGGMKSCFSPQSTSVDGVYQSPLTAIDVEFIGAIFDDPSSSSQYNYFNHQDDKFVAAVKYIQIVYRESEEDIWRFLKRIEVDGSSSSISYRFNGDSNSTPISNNEFYQLFDVVPFKAGTVEAVDSRFVFGDILEENTIAEEPVITDIGSVKWEDPFTTGTHWNTSAGSSFSSLSSADQTEISKRNSLKIQTFRARGLYKAAIIYQDKNGWVSGGYSTDNFTFQIPEDNRVANGQYALTFKFHPSFKPPDWAVAYQIVRTNCLNIDYFMYGIVNKFEFLIDDPAQIPDYATASKEYQAAINLLFDNNSLVTATDFEAIKDPNPIATLLKNRNILSFKNPQVQLDTLNRNRNDLKNTKLTEESGIRRSIAPLIRATKLEASLAKASRLFINIRNWYNASKANTDGSSNNPMNNLYYNYRKGDRVRFAGSTISATPTSLSQKEIFDVEILEFTGNAIIIPKPDGLLWMPGMVTGNYDNLIYDYTIEVYSPRVSMQKDYVYYETGEWYPVLYPGTESRNWSKSDWTYTNNAAVTCTTYGDVKVYNKHPFFYGDCHFIGKKSYFDIRSSGGSPFTFNTIRHPSMTNDKDRTYDFWNRNNGRVNVAYDDLPDYSFKEVSARFGGRFINESNINNINRFTPEDYFDYPQEFGRIRNLINTDNAQVESAGSILLVLAEAKPFSVYVNRVILQDLSGRSQVSVSEKVLGSYNTLLGNYGCRNPESVSSNRGRVYWWSQTEGAWIRYGRDGATSISEFKMRNWFKEIRELIATTYLTDTPAWVTSAFDSFNEELVTRIDHSSLPGTFRGYSEYKGVLFSEASKRWKSVHSWAPDMFAQCEDQLISFKDSSLFIHEKGEDYRKFYDDTISDVMYEPVFSQDEKIVKIWYTLAVIATHKWSVERIQSEYRGGKLLQMSSLPIDRFDDTEDTYKAGILNDENSQGGILNGDKMRSRAIRVLLKLDPDVDTLSLLQYVFAGYNQSPKNP